MLRRTCALATLVLAGLGLALPPATASAAPGTTTLVTGKVIGKVAVGPLAGDDFTPFSGGLSRAQCPSGTVDTYFDIYGRDIGIGSPQGSGDLGYLGVGSRDGRGPQRFSGASIANLRTAFTGSFSSSGTYVIRFACGNAAGKPFAAYESVMSYTQGGNGRFSVSAPRYAELAPATGPTPGPSSTSPAVTTSPSVGAGSAGSPTAAPSATGVASPADQPSADSGDDSLSQGDRQLLGVGIIGAVLLGLVAAEIRRRRRRAEL